MTPIFLNSSSNTYSSYPTDHYEDHLHTHQFLNSNHLNGIFNRDLQSLQYQHEGDKFGSQAYNNDHGIEDNMNNDIHQVKWMSSKMRVMLKMKKSNHPLMNLNTYSSTSTKVAKLEEHKLSSSSMEKTDNSSNNTSSNNIPIRVCSDCNTTKTPLWRSGPRGPKSLCNACGIRQRKARRAMAAAMVAAKEKGNGRIFNDQFTAPLKIIKTQHKDLKKPNKGHVTKYKKRQHSKQIITTTTTIPSSSPSPSPPSSSPIRKNCVEEFLVNLSKNLTLYHVLPQDEREAAILLMALSCGYAHES